MRKAPKYCVTAALVILMFSGCGSGNNEPEVVVRKESPDFTATIGDVQTRAYGQSWESGDKIGISGCNRSNVCYVTNNGDGNFTANTPGEEIIFQNNDEVTFIAYYPWSELTEGVTISADTRMQTSQKDFDFLQAQANGKKSAPIVSFNFTHRMAKLQLTLQPGDNMSYDEVKNVRILLEGICHKGTFNTSDGSTMVDTSGDNGEGWAFTDAEYKAPADYNEAENTVTYSLIFFPQILDGPLTFLAEVPGSSTLRAEIDFTAANREKDGSRAKNEWVTGRQYNLKVTLHRIKVILNECVINPWNDVKGDDITVD